MTTLHRVSQAAASVFLFAVCSACCCPLMPTGDTSATGGPDEKLAGLNEPVTIDGVTVTLTGIAVEKTPLVALGGRETVSTEEYLSVRLRVSTDDPSKIVHYEPFQATFSNDARLVDDFGNSLAMVDHGIMKVKGQAVESSVKKGEPVSDVLVFTKPLPATNTLTLSLPGNNLGLRSKAFRFKFAPPKK